MVSKTSNFVKPEVTKVGCHSYTLQNLHVFKTHSYTHIKFIYYNLHIHVYQKVNIQIYLMNI
jgi:hypothetical protein